MEWDNSPWSTFADPARCQSLQAMGFQMQAPCLSPPLSAQALTGMRTRTHSLTHSHTPTDSQMSVWSSACHSHTRGRQGTNLGEGEGRPRLLGPLVPADSLQPDAGLCPLLQAACQQLGEAGTLHGRRPGGQLLARGLGCCIRPSWALSWRWVLQLHLHDHTHEPGLQHSGVPEPGLSLQQFLTRVQR